MTPIQLDRSDQSLDDGTLARSPGKAPGIEFKFDANPMAFQRRRGARLARGFDFDPELFSTMVELIKDKNSRKYNFGSLLVAKMRELEDAIIGSCARGSRKTKRQSVKSSVNGARLRSLGLATLVSKKRPAERARRPGGLTCCTRCPVLRIVVLRC